MTTIYVLLLEEDKWYVGRTSRDVSIRFREHLSGNGASWTKRYKPRLLVETRISTSPFDEDAVTKEYMSKFGIDNVRGGTTVKMRLTIMERKELRRQIWMAQELCFICGRPGHFGTKCTQRTTIEGDGINNMPDIEDDIRVVAPTNVVDNNLRMVAPMNIPRREGFFEWFGGFIGALCS